MSYRDGRYYQKQLSWMQKQTQKKHDNVQENTTETHPNTISKTPTIGPGVQKNKVSGRVKSRRPRNFAHRRRNEKVEFEYEKMGYCILHIPVCFDTDKGISGVRKDFEIRALENSLRNLESDPVTVYVSINGPTEDKYADKVIELCDEYHAQYFNRPNTGYQWGGYYDTFQKTKNLDSVYYGTLEVDYCLIKNWYELLKNCKKHHIGMPPLKHTIQPHNWPNKWKGDKSQDHTNGAFHFCSKPLLNAIIDQYNCFTNSKGSNHTLDGILHGEVSFCSKIQAVQYSLKYTNALCIPFTN